MTSRVRIVCIGDVYSERGVRGRGGYIGLIPALEQAKQEHPHTIFVHTGDILGGSDLCEMAKGAHVVDVLNVLNCQVGCLGNHEFDFGDDALVERVKETKGTWLGANVRKDGVAFPGVLDSTVIVVDGISVGFFGVCSPATPSLSYPSDNVVFGGLEEAAERCVRELREEKGCDVVVVLSHCAVAQDRRMLSEIDGIDILLGGHDHDPLSVMMPQRSLVFGEQLLFKPGMNAYWLGVIDMELTKVDGVCTGTMSYGYRATPLSAVDTTAPAFQQVDAICRVWEDKRDALAAEAAKRVLIDALPAPMDMRTGIVRTGEASGGSLLADAVLDWTGGVADMALINGGLMRDDRLFKVGERITEADVMRMLPFPTAHALCEIPGKHLLRAVEQHLRHAPEASGGHPHVSGNVVIHYNPTKEPLHRVLSMTINGAPVDPDKMYKVSVTLFMLTGGDGNTAWKKGTKLDSLELRLSAVLAAYLAKHGGTPLLTLKKGRIVSMEGEAEGQQ